jgi:biopolymer transport protein ExbD
VIFVSANEVTVQGEVVVRVEDILAMEGQNIGPIGDKLAELRDRIIGLRTQTVAGSQEVTILADRSIPFSVVKKVMSTCTSQGYERISLAVMQKAAPTSPMSPTSQT